MECIAEAILTYLAEFHLRIDQEVVSLRPYTVKILTQEAVNRFPDKIPTFLLVLEEIFT